jgi:nitroimidazol reductase NimA-like FMN-containing flavoprotein (pyridoxamine 5'-phosphate oxidase superfamily)
MTPPAPLPEAALRERLESEAIIWMATTRPGGRVHLVPVWFAWCRSRIYVRIQPGSVKHANLRANRQVAVSLQDGVHPVICEGRAAFIDPGARPEGVDEVFRRKYDWDGTTEDTYTLLVEVTPEKWLSW